MNHLYYQTMRQSKAINELVEAANLLTAEPDPVNMLMVLLRISSDYSLSEIACLYLKKDSTAVMELLHHQGPGTVPESLPCESELIQFLEECREAIVVHHRSQDLCSGILLHDEVNSGIALPIFSQKQFYGALFLNSRNEYHYGNSTLQHVNALSLLAGGLLKNPVFKFKGLQV